MVDKKYWEKTMENIVLHLKLIRGLRGFYWPMWSDSTSKWHISHLDMMLT